MKLSKRSAKQVTNIEKAFDGIKATIKIYQKKYNKVFDKFDAVDNEHGKSYNVAIRRVNSFVIEGNSIMDTIKANVNNVISTNQRFKYMTYNEMRNKKLSQDDVKKICNYLTDLQGKYFRALSHIKEIQFNAMRESLEIINGDILAYMYKYECRVSIGLSFGNDTSCVKMAWYCNGNYICSTYPVSSSEPADKMQEVKPEDEKKSFSIDDDKKE